MTHRIERGDRLLVIFDGHCGFCNGSVRWLLRRDRWDRLRFVASESPKVAGLLARHGIGPEVQGSGPGTIPVSTIQPRTIQPSTILVARDAGGLGERVFTRSEALVELLGELPRPWPAVGVALGWVPGPVRDLGYQMIARWRYRIWGRLESCPLPTPEERERFL
jgi:predicted DCC family thiol-disulfide oxidoreductase YuxK